MCTRKVSFLLDGFLELGKNLLLFWTKPALLERTTTTFSFPHRWPDNVVQLQVAESLPMLPTYQQCWRTNWDFGCNAKLFHSGLLSSIRLSCLRPIRYARSTVTFTKGIPDASTGGPRILQFALKYTF